MRRHCGNCDNKNDHGGNECIAFGEKKIESTGHKPTSKERAWSGIIAELSRIQTAVDRLILLVSEVNP